ncbi:Uncharacterised protein [Mycobacteroides abscessus subsp. abscessus]|nr:Uncharacterised protein [Mycobacteroides abscessus subsp. abscessus]
MHRQTGPPGPDARRGTERPALGAGPVVPRHHHSHAPRARRRPRHRRRAARTARAHRQPGCAHAGRTARLPPGRHQGTAPQPQARRRAAELPWRLPVPRAVRGGAVRGHRRRSAPPGPAVLHRRRPPRPHERDGVTGHPRRPCRVRPRVGSRGPRTAPARRARAALQPALQGSAQVVVGGTHRRSLPPLQRGAGTATRPGHRPIPGPCRRRRRGSAAGPLHGRADLHDAAGADRRTRATMPRA